MSSNDRILIAPSILSADPLDLGRDIEVIEQGGADWIHIDVMDGHFVPNLTIGPRFVEALSARSDLFLDVHLMIDNPDTQVPWFIKAGADMVVVHAEAATHLHRTLSFIQSEGAGAGVALNPATPVSTIEPVLELVDMVLIMSVNPGFAGQSFIESTPRKIRELKAACERLGVSPHIQVDGGVAPGTAALVAEAGADVLVAGSAVYGADDPQHAIAALRDEATQARASDSGN